MIDWTLIFTNLINYGIAGVIIGVVLFVLVKYFNNKIDVDSKKETNITKTLIEQNQNLIKYVMDANAINTNKIQEAIEGLQSVIEKMMENKEISNNHFLLFIRQVIRLAKFRIQEKVNSIVEKNSLIENREVIMVEIDNIINSDLETIKNDLFAINFNKNGYNEVISIINKHRDEFSSLTKAEFACISEGYDKIILKRKIEGVLNESLREMFEKIEGVLK